MFIRTATVASMFLALISGCATDEGDDLDLAPACESDEKCDAASQEGFEVFEGADGKFYFHLVSANGKIVMRSQAYSSKQAAGRGVESVRVNGVDPANYKVLQASNGEWYTNLYAQNHEIIATSETHARKFNAKRGMETAVNLVSEAQQLRAARSGARFQTFVGDDHQSYFHLRGKNGEVMMQSEGYLNGASAIKAIESVRTNGKVADRYKLLQAADGQWYFTLTAGNNEVIARGETYATKSNAQRAIDTSVALLKSELVADPRPIAAPARSLETSQDLVKVMGALADVAAGGTQHAYFGVAEQAKKPAGADCEAATVEQIQMAFDGLVGEVMAQGDAAARADLTPSLVASSRTQLGTLLGTDTYELCIKTTQGEKIFGTETFILSQAANGPKLVMEMGYEQQ